MPISKYDAQFGGKPGAATEAHDAMAKEYGAKKGERVFYAVKNRNKSRRQMIEGFAKRHHKPKHKKRR